MRKDPTVRELRQFMIKSCGLTSDMAEDVLDDDLALDYYLARYNGHVVMGNIHDPDYVEYDPDIIVAGL